MKRLNWKNISIAFSIILIGIIFMAPIIPDMIRWIFLLIIVILDGLAYWYVNRSKHQNIPYIHSVIKIILVILIIIPNSLFSGFIRNISTKTETFNINFVGLEDLKFESVSELSNKKIGILNDESSKIGYIYPKSIVEEAEIKVKFVEYTSYIDSIQALINHKVDLIVLPGGYEKTFNNIDGLKLDISTLKSQFEVTKKEKSSLFSEHQDILNLVLIGGDNPIEANSTVGFNYDVIIVVSYNFKTQESALISIPRDSYITNVCTNKKDKITHTGWYGAECLTKSLTKLLGIDINKYMLIDFEGLIDVVNSIGGVTIDVDQRIEEQDENRSFENMIVIEAGEQKLNGREALAYLRHRKTLVDGVYGRSNHQEQFILAMIHQLSKPSSWFRINGFLRTVQKSVVTNLSGNSLITYYNDASLILSQKGVDALMPERLDFKTQDAMIYTPSFNKELYYTIIQSSSLKSVKEKFQIINEIE
ncbi:MAG: LCP family protein [Erysipelotrichaceae bacterium]